MNKNQFKFMGKQIAALRCRIKMALESEGRYSPSLDPQIDIAAGYALVFKKLTAELEELDTVIVRDTEDIDSVAEVDEGVKALPAIAENYRKALACLGLASTILEESPKVGRPPKTPVPTSDEDELEKLMRKVEGGPADD